MSAPLDVRPLADLVTSSPALPDEVLRAGRLLLLDTLGCLAGGLRHPPVQALARALGTPDGAALPYGRTVVLGTAATWLDADSGGSSHPQGARLPPVPTAHPAPHVLPVVLQEAVRRDLGDEEVLRAFVLGCEVGLRFGVGTSLRPGLHPHGIHGPVGAAAAACVLRGEDAATTARALELAAALPLAATLAVPVGGGTVRNLWTGLGAWYGAGAAGRAAAGLPSSAALLTDLQGTSVCTDLSTDEITGGLGSRWRVLDSYLKPYACARWVHPVLDALQAASAELGGLPSVDEVEEVDVATFAFAASLDSAEPLSDLHARFSVPLSVSALLHDGALHAASFLPEGLARPSLAALARRVRVREEPAYSAALPRERPTRVALLLRDGRRAAAEVRGARGDPATPLRPDEVADKFRANAGELLPAGVRDGVVGALAGVGSGAAGLGGRTVAAAGRALLAGLGAPPRESTGPTAARTAPPRRTPAGQTPAGPAAPRPAAPRPAAPRTTPARTRPEEDPA